MEGKRREKQKNEQGLGEIDVNVHTSIYSAHVHAITAKHELAAHTQTH